MFILYKFASRSRPDKFFKALDNIRVLSHSNEYHVLASLDIDDNTMNNDEVKDGFNNYPNLSVYFGLSNSKIHAINRDLQHAPPFDILVNMSDDMGFTKPGYDNTIRRDMLHHFPDLDGFIHYPDGFANQRTSTMNITGRVYFERTGYIYHPDYITVYCDNEETEKAKMLSKYAYIPEQIFSHEHPFNLRQPYDDLYNKNESGLLHSKDSETYYQRRLINFGIK